MIKRLAMILSLALFLVLPVCMPAFAWDKIVSFGDSLSDDGNGGANNFPGILGPGDTGPCTNEAVWLTHLAESIGAELEGRAISGARTTGPVKGFGDIGMLAQIDRYISSLDGDEDLSNTLFTIWIGGNDFLKDLIQYLEDAIANPPADVPPNPFLVIEPAIINIQIAVQELVDAGAENILIMNMPDLGLAPVVIDPLKPVYTAACEAFNAALGAGVCSLRSFNEGIARFYMADTFGLLQYAVNNGDALGVPNAVLPCGDDDELCDISIFYDLIHPTDATHKYLAALALGQVKDGFASKELKNALKELNPIHPRKPFVVNCVDDD